METEKNDAIQKKYRLFPVKFFTGEVFFLQFKSLEPRKSFVLFGKEKVHTVWRFMPNKESLKGTPIDKAINQCPASYPIGHHEKLISSPSQEELKRFVSTFPDPNDYFKKVLMPANKSMDENAIRDYQFQAPAYDRGYRVEVPVALGKVSELGNSSSVSRG